MYRGFFLIRNVSTEHTWLSAVRGGRFCGQCVLGALTRKFNRLEQNLSHLAGLVFKLCGLPSRDGALSRRQRF
jgi:hypothetical protein